MRFSHIDFYARTAYNNLGVKRCTNMNLWRARSVGRVSTIANTTFSAKGSMMLSGTDIAAAPGQKSARRSRPAPSGSRRRHRKKGNPAAADRCGALHTQRSSGRSTSESSAGEAASTKRRRSGWRLMTALPPASPVRAISSGKRALGKRTGLPRRPCQERA